jgi:hypothetical protein
MLNFLCSSQWAFDFLINLVLTLTKYIFCSLFRALELSNLIFCSPNSRGSCSAVQITNNVLLSLSLPGRRPRLQREVEGPRCQGLPDGWLAVLTQEAIDAVEVAVSPYTPGAFRITAVATWGATHPTGDGCRLLVDEAGGGAGSLPHVCLF